MVPGAPSENHHGIKTASQWRHQLCCYKWTEDRNQLRNDYLLLRHREPLGCNRHLDISPASSVSGSRDNFLIHWYLIFLIRSSMFTDIHIFLCYSDRVSNPGSTYQWMTQARTTCTSWRVQHRRHQVYLTFPYLSQSFYDDWRLYNCVGAKYSSTHGTPVLDPPGYWLSIDQRSIKWPVI